MTDAILSLRIFIVPPHKREPIDVDCFFTPFSLAKVWRGRLSPMNRLKYRHKKLRQPSADYCIIWVFLIFYLIFLGLKPLEPLPDIPARKKAKTVKRYTDEFFDKGGDR